MYKSVQKASPEFMQRYTAIKNGKEKLDTVAKLKEFWLFTAAEGWKNSAAVRYYIARLAFEIAPYDELIRGTGASNLFMAYNCLETFSVDRSRKLSSEFADSAWRSFEYFTNEIKAKFL